MYSGEFRQNVLEKIEPWIAGDRKDYPSGRFEWFLKCGLKEGAPSDVQKAYKRFLDEMEYERRTLTRP